MPTDMATRVLRRVEATTGRTGGEGGSPTGTPAARSTAPASSSLRGLLAARAPFGAAMFVLGAFAGVALHAQSRPFSTPPVQPSKPPEPPPASSRPEMPTPIVARSVPSAPDRTAMPPPIRIAAAPPTTGNPPAPPSSTYGRDADLAAERSLIDIARTALARGQAAAALDAAKRHARRFPRGQLAEERESVWIQALVATNDRDEARSRAARFRSTFPDSIFLPIVENAIQSIP